MAKGKVIGDPRRPLSSERRVVERASRGQFIVQSWPRKRGYPKSTAQAFWVEWFRQANLLAKYASGYDQRAAIRYAKGTALYPRDRLMAAMRGTLYYITTTDGRRMFPVQAYQSVTDALDTISQNHGAIIFRGAAGWVVIEPDSPGQFLRCSGPDADPIWATPSGGGGGGGVSEVELPNSPIACDNSVASYEFDLGGFAQVRIQLDAVAFAANSFPAFQLSLDGGSTWKNGATDYRQQYMAADGDNSVAAPQMNFSHASNTTPNYGTWTLAGIGAARPSAAGMVGNGNRTRLWSAFPNFAGTSNRLRLISVNGPNFSTGTIRATGMVAA